MIEIKPSPTADTRTCDVAIVTKEQLLEASEQHIEDVKKALDLFGQMLAYAGGIHDYDKLTRIDHFHSDFRTKFKETSWWDNHRRMHRHHLSHKDGTPSDVNLIDVLEYIADCVMAGMARSGQVYPLKLDQDVLKRAFDNTVEFLKAHVTVVEEQAEEEA